MPVRKTRVGLTLPVHHEKGCVAQGPHGKVGSSLWSQYAVAVIWLSLDVGPHILQMAVNAPAISSLGQVRFGGLELWRILLWCPSVWCKASPTKATANHCAVLNDC